MKARALIATIATALALSSCSSQPAQAAQVCVDPVSNLRVDDSMCAHPIIPNAYIWWYVTSGYTIPAYGWPVAYGYATPPRHTIIVNNVQSSGGVYPKPSRFGSNKTTSRTIQPTSAATQAPPPKKQSWNNKPANKPAQAQPKTQSQQKWQQYKPPPAPKQPAPYKPPSYPKYR